MGRGTCGRYTFNPPPPKPKRGAPGYELLRDAAILAHLMNGWRIPPHLDHAADVRAMREAWEFAIRIPDMSGLGQAVCMPPEKNMRRMVAAISALGAARRVRAPRSRAR